MNARRLAMLGAIACMLVLGFVYFIHSGAPFAADNLHALELANGTTVKGVVMQLHPERYLVQTGGQCLLLAADQVRKVDGNQPGGPGLPFSGAVPRTQETFENILPTGEIELHSTFTVQNDGAAIMYSVDWGVAAHEIDQLDRTKVIDAYGNTLDLHVKDDPTIKGKRASVVFPRPVLPGEEARLTMVIGNSGRAERIGSAWRYRMDGDYPDNRLVTRSVLLPAGARITSVSPEPLRQISSTDRPLVVWRRYFVKGEIVPWEIHYEL
jgi:hypothetical protein